MDKITNVTFAPAFAVVGALVVINFLLKVGVWRFYLGFFLYFGSAYINKRNLEKMDSIHCVYTYFVSY
jgi:hypothetical protein